MTGRGKRKAQASAWVLVTTAATGLCIRFYGRINVRWVEKKSLGPVV